MIFILAAGFTVLILAQLLLQSHWLVPVLFAVKPVIDATWNVKLAGFSLLDIVGAAVPIVMLTRIVFGRGLSLTKMPMFRVATVFVVWNVIVAAGIALTNENVMSGAEYFFRALSFYLAIFLIPFYVRNTRRFRRLLIFLLIAGLFPMLVGIYQAATGTIWELRVTASGALQRNVGMYHDAFSFRAYGFQTLTAIILYWSYFRPRAFFVRAAIVCYSIICVVVIFKVYSKAAVVIAVSWMLIWSVLHQQRWAVIASSLGAVAFLVYFETNFAQEIGTLFYREVGAYTGDVQEKSVLAGRPTIWVVYWQEWLGSDLLAKVGGLWKSVPAHNDFLRILYTSGLVGLLAYCAFLVRAGMLLLKSLSRGRSNMSIVGLMLFAMWMVDVAGLNPSLYPAYSWYVWGFIVLAIKGVPGLDGLGHYSPKQARNLAASNFPRAIDQMDP